MRTRASSRRKGFPKSRVRSRDVVSQRACPPPGPAPRRTTWHAAPVGSQDAAPRWRARLRGDRPRRLPRLRSPLRAGARSAGRAGDQAGAQRPDDRADPGARLRSRAALSRRAACQRPERRRDHPRRIGREHPPGPAGGRRPDPRGHARRGRRRLPGDVLRRDLRGHADFLLRVEPGRGAAERARRLALRGRRHEAGATRQGGCRAPDLLLRRAARADPGPSARAPPRGPRGSARETVTLRVDDYMAYYGGSRPTSWAAADATPAGLPADDDLPEPVEHCDVCAGGWTVAVGGGRTTT